MVLVDFNENKQKKKKKKKKEFPQYHDSIRETMPVSLSIFLAKKHDTYLFDWALCKIVIHNIPIYFEHKKSKANLQVLDISTYQFFLIYGVDIFYNLV